MLPARHVEQVEGLGDVDESVAESNPVVAAGAQKPWLKDLALPAERDGAAEQ